MASVALTGKDTIIIDSRILNDLADADTGVLEFPNNLSEVKAGKNGNALYAFNAQGVLVNFTLRVIRGSSDDKYLMSRLQQYINDPAGFIFMEAELIKRAGDGAGNITTDTYKVAGGVPQKMPAAKENVTGDTEQAVSIYAITFGNTQRTLG